MCRLFKSFPLLSVLLLLFAFAVACTPTVVEPGVTPLPATAGSAYPAPPAQSGEVAERAYPGPAILSPTAPLEEATYPTPIIIEIYPGTPTPWASFTPPPQPTSRPGPTETPLPLRQPAGDTAGFIIYATSNNVDDQGRKNGLAIMSLAMGETGISESGPVRLTGDAELDLQWGAIHPSPDGSRLAVESNWGGVAIFNLDIGELEPLAIGSSGGAGGFLGWHPDSRRILFRQDAGPDAGLWLVDTQQFTGLVRERTASAISDAAASPNGQKVVYSFCRGFGDVAQLYVLNVNGSDRRVLYTAESDIFLISWSPDGSQIAFLGDKGYTLMSSDGASLRTLPIANFPGTFPFEPVWSPDSRMIAYVASDGTIPYKLDPPDPFQGATLRLIDVTTGEDRPLLSDSSSGHIDPAWSPDGSQIVFASIHSGAPEIWAVNVDGTNLRQLTNDNQFVRFPTWTRFEKSQ